jgi:hypothetical protein
MTHSTPSWCAISSIAAMPISLKEQHRQPLGRERNWEDWVPVFGSVRVRDFAVEISCSSSSRTEVKKRQRTFYIGRVAKVCIVSRVRQRMSGGARKGGRTVHTHCDLVPMLFLQDIAESRQLLQKLCTRNCARRQGSW